MTSQLRICLNAGFFREVGTYWTAFFLGKELAKRGHDVTLLCISPDHRFTSSEYRLEGMRLIECPNVLNRPVVLHGMGPLDIWRRLRLLLDVKFDVVHGFEYYPDVTFPVWLTRLFRPYVYVSDWRDWFAQGLHYGRFGHFPGSRRFLAFLENNARLIANGVTVGSRNLEQHVQNLGLSSSNIMLLSGGSPLDTVQPLPICQARLAVDIHEPDAKIIGFLSSTQSVGLNSFLEPITTLFSEMPNLRFLMIGNPDKEFLDGITARGYRKRVIVSGWVAKDRLPYYLGSSDLFILPLNSDLADASRWPLKMGDYLAAGRPVVGSDVGDTPAILRKYNAGHVVKNKFEITRALRDILTMACDQKESMGIRARKAAEESLSWAARAQELEDFYMKLMKTNEPV